MSDVLTPKKAGRGWIIEVPAEMAQAMGVAEGSVIVLYPSAEGGMSYEVLPPLSPDIEASVLQTCDEFREAFEEMKRLGD
jgi:bifunctional DNA-binding transcriptional regulator/antitoxin component of YhaV-PrlF toxin-antitoxin module